MLIKSKYKIARRLGPGVFEKTQTPKYAARAGRITPKRSGGRGGQSEYGKALLEKQKARFTYLISEGQFKKYADFVISDKTKKPDEHLFEMLEMRLDNAICRMGIAKTRLAARQIVSHGHISIGGKRVTVRSYNVKVGEVISLTERSKKSKLFSDLAERAKEYNPPNWLTFDPSKMEGKVVSKPILSPAELAFDISIILDFYKR